MVIQQPIVAGFGAVRIDRHFGMSSIDLAVESLKDLESRHTDIDLAPDTVIVSSMHPEIMQEQSGIAGVMADYLDLKGVRVYRVESGEASGLAAVNMAYTLIRSGLSRSTLVIGVEKVTEYPTSMITRAYSLIEDSDYKGFYGVTPAAEAALLAKIYMKRYGYSYQDLYKWPYLMHSTATTNPYAQLKFRLKDTSYEKSPIISDPLRLVDMFPYGDGAACIVVSDGSAVDKRDAVIAIAGVGASSDIVDPFVRSDPVFFDAVKNSFNQAVAMADVNRDQIKYIELHDSFTPYAYIAMESMGLVERGASVRSLSDDLTINGTYVNLSGGLKARGHPWGATGVYQVGEVFRALRGEEQYRSIDPIYAGLAQNMNGPGAQSYTTLLRRVD